MNMLYMEMHMLSGNLTLQITCCATESYSPLLFDMCGYATNCLQSKY